MKMRRYATLKAATESILPTQPLPKISNEEQQIRDKNSTGVFHVIAGGFSAGPIPLEITRGYVYETAEEKPIEIQVGHEGQLGIYIGGEVYFIKNESAEKLFTKAMKLLKRKD